ncbi:hypothetical protein PPYR_01758 [Photinus pyralis]|uniref:Fas apoptotic inhibitory molecule 1 n=1 Tax=Photinus pyralis TaxID=7054 RepID=A0A5N4B5G3_PHOPY|nr:fas apoptotic inhibitory molecule 1 [Photinus pyralis]KAB0804788.1 hypothetical protein PPYR_01758 [Photinus pyralis]
MDSISDNDRSNLVAYWSVPLNDGVYTIEFEHGTTTGRRVLRVNGEEILRREWMFKLVGNERFNIGKQAAKCELHVDPLPYFAFSYSLTVDGKSLEKFTEQQNKAMRSWGVLVEGERYRIVLEKQTLDVWLNGQKEEVEHVFTHDGSEINFQLGEAKASIRAVGAVKKEGVIYQLYINDELHEDEPETAE